MNIKKISAPLLPCGRSNNPPEHIKLKEQSTFKSSKFFAISAFFAVSPSTSLQLAAEIKAQVEFLEFGPHPPTVGIPILGKLKQKGSIVAPMRQMKETSFDSQAISSSHACGITQKLHFLKVKFSLRKRALNHDLKRLFSVISFAPMPYFGDTTALRV